MTRRTLITVLPTAAALAVTTQLSGATPAPDQTAANQELHGVLTAILNSGDQLAIENANVHLRAVALYLRPGTPAKRR